MKPIIINKLLQLLLDLFDWSLLLNGLNIINLELMCSGTYSLKLYVFNKLTILLLHAFK